MRSTDLKGMKIGVTGPGSASAMGLRMLLAKASLTADDVAIIGVGGGPGAVAAVRSGKLDAIANFDPVISLLERDGAINVILDTRQQKGLDYLYGGPFAASAFYVRRPVRRTEIRKPCRPSSTPSAPRLTG